MSKKISTRFFLTRCDPEMQEENVKKYVRDNFHNASEVYVRKLTMNHGDYSSFIFIINTNVELNIDDFEQHKWPGVIRCFFAPRDKHWKF